MHKSPINFRTLGAGAYEAVKGRDFPFHQHSEWELVYYRSGHIDFLLGDEIVPVSPGVLLFAPPGIPHAERALSDYANFHLLIAAPVATAWPRICFDDALQTFNRLCYQLVDEFRNTHFKRSEMVNLLTDQLALAVERAIRNTHVTLQERLVRKAEVLIATEFTQPLRIGDVARQIGVSTSFLRKLFSELRGCSPLQHLQRVRQQKAFALLTTSDLTLEHVAELNGYDSVSHLSRHIKRAYGKSPGALRRGRGANRPSRQS